MLITFLSIIAIPIYVLIYVLSISPIFGMLILVFLAAYVILRKKRSREAFFVGNKKELIIIGFNVFVMSALAYRYWLYYQGELVLTAVFVILATGSFLAFIPSAYKYEKQRQDQKYRILHA